MVFFTVKASQAETTSPEKSVLANQCAVFRSGDKASCQFENTR